MRLLCTKNIVLGMMLLFFPLSATQLKLELSNDGQGRAGGNAVAANVPFEVTVTVIDGNRDTGTVELNGADQVKVVGTSCSTNISMLNGRFSSQTSYIYQLNALKEGPLKLGPAQLKQGGQTIESNTLELQVSKAPDQPQPASAKGGTTPTSATAEASTSEQQAAILCRLTANKKTAVVGEPITTKLTILSRGPILQVAMEPPKFSGFMVKEIQSVSRRQETFQNATYNVLEKQYILIPNEHGAKTIEPVKVAYAVPVRHRPRHHSLFDDAFFAGFFDQERIEQKTAISNALQVTIAALPENQGQIDGVGEFTSFTAHVNKKEAHVNEALTFTLEISGEGNLEQIVTPKLILPAFMKAYDSKTSTAEDTTSDYHGGKKTFEYVIQIAQEGDAEVPSQQFVYFDTAHKTIKTLKTPPVTVHLTPAPQVQQPKIAPVKATEEPEEDTATAQPKKNIKKDISFIQEDGPIMQGSRPGINLFILLLLLLLIPALMVGKRFFTPAKAKLFPQLFKDRNRKKYLDQLHKEFDILQQQKQIDKLYQFFVKFLATTHNVEVETITHDWLQELLVNLHWEEAKINEFFDFLNECASCHFVSPAHAKVDHTQLFKKGSYWLLLLSK
jgi:hypothetical protein